MTRANLRVRPVQPDDVAGLVRLTQSVDLTSGTFSGRPLLDDTAAHLEQRFESILAEGTRTMLVAVDDSDGVVGLLVARRDEVGAIDLTPVLLVSHLMVSPKFRRRGVGRMLLTAALHLAEESGIDHVLATAGTGSREANRYLARLGFAPLVVHRVAPTSVLRRSLGITEAPERMAVLRRARMRATRPAIGTRVVRRGA